MAKRPMPAISLSRLDSLMRALEVAFVRLVECVVSPGWRLSLAAAELTGIHYNLKGKGRIIIGEGPPLALEPHTLAIIPPRRPFIIEDRHCETRTDASRRRSSLTSRAIACSARRTSSQGSLLPAASSLPTLASCFCILFLDGLAPRYRIPFFL